ncbi:MAG: hypothetical protein ACRDAX_07700 [Propionibacteriaceae bacterium]
MSPHIRTRVAIAIAFFIAILGIIVVPRMMSGNSNRHSESNAVEAAATSQTVSPHLNITTTTASPSSTKKDNAPPAPPRELALLGNTLDTFTLTWKPSPDSVGTITHYLVAVNGTVVANVNVPIAELVWPGGPDQVLVQVAAVDANGNQSPWSAVWIIPPAGVPLIPRTTPASDPTTTKSEPAVPLPTSDIVTPEPTTQPSSRSTEPDSSDIAPIDSPSESLAPSSAPSLPESPVSPEPSSSCSNDPGVPAPYPSVTPTITAAPPPPSSSPSPDLSQPSPIQPSTPSPTPSP